MCCKASRCGAPPIKDCANFAWLLGLFTTTCVMLTLKTILVLLLLSTACSTDAGHGHSSLVVADACAEQHVLGSVQVSAVPEAWSDHAVYLCCMQLLHQDAHVL